MSSGIPVAELAFHSSDFLLPGIYSSLASEWQMTDETAPPGAPGVAIQDLNIDPSNFTLPGVYYSPFCMQTDG
jgi:hypothetical protein